MPGLCELPEELILEIFHYFSAIRSSEPQETAFKNTHVERARQCENCTRQRTLCALSLSSHHLRRIATPLLYASYSGVAGQHGLETLELFHRTISSSEHSIDVEGRLAHCLQYVENRLADYLGNSLYDDVDIADPLKMVARYFYLLADVVRQAPNLQHLCIVSLETDIVTFWDHVLSESAETLTRTMSGQVAAVKLGTLQVLCFQLHTVEMGYPSEGTWLSRIWSAVIAAAPCLVDVRAACVVSAVTPYEQVPTFRSSTNLQRLEITECALTFLEVVNIWSACDRLRHIRCHWAHLSSGGDTAADLYPGLLPHRDTLESLHLDMRQVRCFVATPPVLGSLQSFALLKTLTLCETALFGTGPSPRLTIDGIPHFLAFNPSPRRRIAELTPQHLQSLTLLVNAAGESNYLRHTNEASTLWELVDDCKSAATHLENFNISCDAELSVSSLGDAFSDVGVSFGVVRKG